MAEAMQGRPLRAGEDLTIVTLFHEPTGEVAGVYCNPDVEGLTAVGYSLTITVTKDGATTTHTRHFSLNHYRVHVDN